MSRVNDSMIRLPDVFGEYLGEQVWVNRFKVIVVSVDERQVSVQVADSSQHGQALRTVCGTAEQAQELAGRVLHLIRYGEDDITADPLLRRLTSRVAELETELAALRSQP